tara:strand:+ start:19 stop:204 length:186 start_codon:yes stop_codon:yes gene_type:complete
MGIKNADFIGIKNIICTKRDWLNMDREEKIQKECQERKENPPVMTPLQSKLINQVTLVRVS